MRRIDKKLNMVKANILAESRYMESKELIGNLTENYDFVSQFKGVHDGNPMSKNKYLNSLGLDEDGIETLQIWVNTMIQDKYWFNKKYPNGASYVDLISDISEKVKDLPSFILKYKSINPIKVVNFLKD